MDARATDLEKAGNLVEAQRLRKRVDYDVRMIRETGFVNGIENYSPYFDNRLPGETPYTIFDYFPDDFLLIIDESHMTLPQLMAMPKADTARKVSLVKHGFRLPSAVDHRPIRFEELEVMMDRKHLPSSQEGLGEISNGLTSPLLKRGQGEISNGWEYKYSPEFLQKNWLVSNWKCLPYRAENVEYAKKLRKTMTLEEKKLRNQFLKQQEYRVLRQKPIDHYIVDFYIADAKLVIEVDWESHNNPQTQKDDANRMTALQMYGLEVIRFSNEQIRKDFDTVCTTISQKVESYQSLQIQDTW